MTPLLRALCGTLLSTSLFACNSAISLSCQEKLLDSHAFDNAKTSITIANGYRLVYSQKQLTNAVKADNFLGLYLFKEQKKFQYPFIFVHKPSKSVVANAPEIILEGRIRKHQIGLNTLAQFNQPLSLPSVITDNCCALEGIVTNRGVIEKVYLEHFITRYQGSYADIGIRIKQAYNKVIVTRIDPFVISNPFKEGDVIVGFNGVAVSSASELMQKILFSKIGKKVSVDIIRASKKKRLYLYTQKRLGGGLLCDTFLEHIGFYLNRDAVLLEDVRAYHLRKNDKIIMLNGKNIKSSLDIYDAFDAYKDNKFLIKRGGFSFYIKVDALYKKFDKNDIRIFNH